MGCGSLTVRDDEEEVSKLKIGFSGVHVARRSHRVMTVFLLTCSRS